MPATEAIRDPKPRLSTAEGWPPGVAISARPLLAHQRGALGPLAVIQAVRDPSILLSHREQLLADMLDRLSFGHAAEFFSFLFVMGRSFLGGPRSKIHFPGRGAVVGRCVARGILPVRYSGSSHLQLCRQHPNDGGHYRLG